MEKLRALIVDDESLGRRGLRLRLQKHGDVEIVGECSNGREALRAIPELSPDIVFLDIQMPGIDGFEVVRSLQADGMPLVVFVTAFDQYAVQAFDVHAVDYILKPADDERLARALLRARERLHGANAAADKQRLLEVIGDLSGRPAAQVEEWKGNGSASPHSYPDRIGINDGGEITLVAAAEIDWVDAAGDYMCIHAGGRIHVMRSTMKSLESQLDPAVFQRVHRSTIVNTKRIRQVCPHMNGEYHLVLEGGARLKMSRSYRDRIRHIV
jgi:two-component system LytT family response regulator